MEETCLNFIPTRCSSLKTTAVQYQEVVYNNPSKVKKTKNGGSNLLTTSHNENVDSPRVDNQEIDMKRARYEIKKFAKTNAKSSNRQRTLRELAVELGARPLRKKPINYKDLLKIKQKNRERRTRKEELKKLGQLFNGKSILKNKKKSKPVNKSKSGILDIYGKPKIPARDK